MNVTPNPWNPNTQSKEMFEKGVNSVKELGLLGAITVRETGLDMNGVMWYQILDGEHRWKYCNELGYTEIDVENIGIITDQQAQFLTVHLNNLKGKDDLEKRAKIFEALDAGQLSMLPFTGEQIENEKALFKFDFGKFKNDEVLADRKPNRNFIIPLTEDEYKVVTKLMEEIKTAYNQEPIQWLMEKVKADLDLFLGVNVETDNGTKEF